MSIRQLPLFCLVSVLLGVPYVLITFALGGFSPLFVAWARVAIAAAVLVAAVKPASVVRAMREQTQTVAVLAIVQFCVPMVLIAVAERSVASSLAGCLIASEPLWIAVLAWRVDPAQRLALPGIAALIIGLLGVAVLLGADPGGAEGMALLVLLAAGSYGLAALFVGRMTTCVSSRELVAASLAVAAVVLLPLAAVGLPSRAPDTGAVLAVAALGVLCTAVAFPLWFTLIDRVGAASAGLVTYVSPLVALALGVGLRGEHPGRFAPLGLALILAGCWAAARAPAMWPQRRPARHTPARATTRPQVAVPVEQVGPGQSLQSIDTMSRRSCRRALRASIAAAAMRVRLNTSTTHHMSSARRSTNKGVIHDRCA
jgi:drug/metabolite transporter (DMT)-like permease